MVASEDQLLLHFQLELHFNLQSFRNRIQLIASFNLHQVTVCLLPAIQQSRPLSSDKNHAEDQLSAKTNSKVRDATWDVQILEERSRLPPQWKSIFETPSPTDIHMIFQS